MKNTHNAFGMIHELQGDVRFLEEKFNEIKPLKGQTIKLTGQFNCAHCDTSKVYLSISFPFMTENTEYSVQVNKLEIDGIGDVIESGKQLNLSKHRSSLAIYFEHTTTERVGYAIYNYDIDVTF